MNGPPPPSQSVLHRFFATTPDLILVTDSYGTFLEVSPSVHDILGYSQAEMIGRTAVGFIHPADLAPTRDEMRQTRQTGIQRHFTARYITKSGETVMLLWRGLWDDETQKYFFVGRDLSLTESLRLLRRLEQRVETMERTIPAALPWLLSLPHLMELSLIVSALWAGLVLTTGPGNFAASPASYALLKRIPLPEGAWGSLALLAALLFAFGNGYGIWTRQPKLWASFVPRLLGYVCSAMFWLPVGVSIMVGNPNTLSSGLALSAAIFSVVSLARLSR